MTDQETLDFLRHADSGKANFIQDRKLTYLGDHGYWEMELIGVEPCEPYVAHGNFNVDRQGVFRSRLTEKGRDMLRLLEEKLDAHDIYCNCNRCIPPWDNPAYYDENPEEWIDD